MNRIVAIVVTYNRKEMLKRCINQLKIQTAACDILIIDNASTDGTADYLRNLEKDPKIHIVYLEKNIGGAGGFNIGIKKAAEYGYKAIWLMDDDTLPREDALSQLLDADEKLEGNYGFLSSVVLWTDGFGCRMNRQKMKKDYYKDIKMLYDGLIPVEQATFVSFFMRMKMVEKAGLPVKEFFIWGDDLEYTRRLAVRMQLPCYLVGKSQVVHAMNSNNGSCLATDVPERIGRYRYAYRNENYAYRYEGIKGVLYYIAKCSLNLIRIWGKSSSHKIKRSWIIISQMFMGLWFNPQIEMIQKEK